MNCGYCFATVSGPCPTCYPAPLAIRDPELHTAMASLGWLSPDPLPVTCSSCNDVIPGGDCGFGPDASLCQQCDYRRERAVARDLVMAELADTTRRSAKIAETLSALKLELQRDATDRQLAEEAYAEELDRAEIEEEERDRREDEHDSNEVCGVTIGVFA